MNYDEFLVAIRPPLNESRLKVINMAFDKMDKNGDGVVTVEDLKMTYNVKFHPAYINGLCALESFGRNGTHCSASIRFRLLVIKVNLESGESFQ